MKIMIIEDDKYIREELSLLLATSLYQPVPINDFHDVAGQIEREQPDLVLLDINLPEQNGQEICRLVRQRMSVPIIFITSDQDVMTEVNAMLLGGDDYIAKPYHPSVLLARIAAVLKRTQNQPSEGPGVLEHKGVTLDTKAYRIGYDGRQEELSKNECRLLGYLFLHKGEIVPRLDLIEYLWDNEVFIDDNALSVNVTRIRAKLAGLGITDFIETKRGIGYRI